MTEVFCAGACYRAAYLDWGQGPPLLCLHGFGGNKANWLAVMRQLASRYRCISLDLLGFGESSQPPVEYGIALEVAFVSSFVNHMVGSLELEAPAVAGHSFGAWVAAAYALQQPSTPACVLVAPIGLHGDGFGDRCSLLQPALQQSAVARGRSGNLSRWETEKLDAVAANLCVPTLVVAAERDEIVPASCPRTYARRIPNARLQVIPGAGHALPLTHAREVAAAIAAFLPRS